MRRPRGATSTPSFASGPNDFFNYGIHVVEMVQGAIGLDRRTPAVSVTYLGGHGAERLLVDYRSGLQAVLDLEAAAGFFLAVSGGGGRWSAAVESDFYRALLEDVVAHFQGKRPFPADIDMLCEAVMILLAGRESMRRGRLTSVRIDDLPADAPGFDGHAFTAAYRAAVG